MAYATAADVAAQYGDDLLLTLADRDGDGTADPGVAEAALADATQEIDSYLAARYDLPLEAGKARLLRRVAVDIAVYRLAGTADLVTDERRRRYEDAVRYLTKVSQGQIRLGADGDDRPAYPQRVRGSSRLRVFGRGRRLA